MIEPYEMTTHAGVITLFKTNLSWRRSRLVHVVAGFKHRTLDFPADLEVLTINGLPPDETCWLTIRHGDFLKRLLGRPRRFEILAKDRRLQAVISGSGACGLHAVSDFLNGLSFYHGPPAIVRHETLWEHILPAIAAENLETVRHIVSGLMHDIETAMHFAVVPQTIVADRIVHLIRDGRHVVQSGLSRGWYQNDRIWNRFRPSFSGDAFSCCCHFWASTVRNMDSCAHKVVRLEDLVASREAITDLLDYLEISPTERPFTVTDQPGIMTGCEHWRPAQHALFADICGELMDIYYPGWQGS